jgi:hypothetical protein
MKKEVFGRKRQCHKRSTVAVLDSGLEENHNIPQSG